MIHFKDDSKLHTNKVEELKKQLSEMKKQKETSESQLSEMTKQKETIESKCSKLKATYSILIQEADQARALNETLKKYMQHAQVNLLLAGDEAFERAKAQVVCIMPDLDVSKMYFFKNEKDLQLVDMEEASPEVEVLKDVAINNSTLEAQDDEHH